MERRRAALPRVELMVYDSGAAFQIDLRDAPDASQENEGACAELGHELLERRRVDLVVERYDEQCLAGRGVVETVDRRFRRAGSRHLAHAEVVRMTVCVDRTAERAQRLLADPESSGGARVVGLRAHPGKHHRADMLQRDRCPVVDDQQLPAQVVHAQGDPELSGAEVVAVLYRLDDALERAGAQALCAAFGSAAARLEKRRLVFNQLRQPLNRGRREFRRSEFGKAVHLRPAMREVLGRIPAKLGVCGGRCRRFRHTIRIAAAGVNEKRSFVAASVVVLGKASDRVSRPLFDALPCAT